MTDQAIYEVKTNAKKIERWVRNTLSGASEIEIKVKEATNNDKWGPTGKQMQDISNATHSFEHFDPIMKTIWARLNDNGKYWRHVYKALLLLEYLIKNGSEQVVRACHSNGTLIQTLTKFQYVTEKGKDEGENIRNRARILVELLSDDGRIREERQRAQETRRRFDQSMSSEQGGFGGSRGGSYNEDYGNYSRGDSGSSYSGGRSGGYGDERGGRGGYGDDDRGFGDERSNRSGDRYGDERSNRSGSGYNDRGDDSYERPKKTPSQSEKKPRPPSTELTAPVTTQTQAPPPQKTQPSLIELFDSPVPTPQPQNQMGGGFGGFQSGGSQTSGFGGFQSGGSQTSGFGQFQSGGSQTSGFGQFQSGGSQTSGFGGFQSGGSQTSGFGDFQSGGSQTTGFGQTTFGGFQSGNNDSFDSFNPRGGGSTGGSTGGSFANFDNPGGNNLSPQQPEKKGMWEETSSLVNLTNLVEEPNQGFGQSNEKKTLGQTLQNKGVQQKPVMGGTPLITPTPSFTTMTQPQAPTLNIQALTLQQIQQLTPQQIQQLNPTQLQQLQLQYQMQLLQLQQQQNQLGGRGF